MQDAKVGSVYDEALALLERTLALCDDAEIGTTAAPHIDLALNLLRAEAQVSRSPTPAPK